MGRFRRRQQRLRSLKSRWLNAKHLFEKKYPVPPEPPDEEKIRKEAEAVFRSMSTDELIRWSIQYINENLDNPSEDIDSSIQLLINYLVLDKKCTEYAIQMGSHMGLTPEQVVSMTDDEFKICIDEFCTFGVFRDSLDFYDVSYHEYSGVITSDDIYPLGGLYDSL